MHDEAQTIGRAIKSYGQICDEIVALDVGSTDGAIEIVRDLGVEVHEHEWTVYSKANEHMFQLARGRADYALLFSATETVELTEPMPDVMDAPIYVVKQMDHGVICRSARFFDTSIDWTSPDPVHANIEPQFLEERRELPGVTVTIHDDDGRRPGKLARYRDELEAWLLDHPDDASSLYYLATTYYHLGCVQAAGPLFARRAQMTTGDVQAWHALYMAGACRMHSDIVGGAKLMLDCFSSHPERMEPLWTLENVLHQIREKTAMPTEGTDLNYVSAEAYLG